MENRNAYNKYLVLPPLAAQGLLLSYPHHAIVQLICAIPYGKGATVKDIEKCLSRAYKVNCFEAERFTFDPIMQINEQYPFWRVVSERGHLIGAKACQKEKLEGEGLSVEIPNPEADAAVVVDYKAHLYKFDDLNVSVMPSINDENIRMMLSHTNRGP